MSKIGSKLGGATPHRGKFRRKNQYFAKVFRTCWPAFPIGLLIVLLRWRYQHSQHQASLQSFVKFSSYRIGEGEFAAIGLAPLERRGRTRFRGCSWKDNGGGSWYRPIQGHLKPYYPGEHHDLLYEAIILHCKLRHGTSGRKGGQLFMNIDDKTILIYDEEANAFPGSLEPTAPFKHHVTFCSPPVHSAIDAKRIYEWLEYHIYLGIDYFILYDAGGITDDVLQTLLPYESKFILEVRDVRETLELESWLYGQVMVINDCAYSTRYLSKWTIFFDLDEFFNADDPPSPYVKRAHNEAKQQELHATEHWQKQLEKLQRKHHREVYSGRSRESKRLMERMGRNMGNGEDDLEDPMGPFDPIPHPKKFLLEERQSKEISEEEERKAKEIQIKQEKQYMRLKKKKARNNIWDRKISAAEQKIHLEQQIKEQKEQMEVIKAYREQLHEHSKKTKLIPLVLDSYGDSAYLTFGTMWWDVERCILNTEAQGDWAIQRMLYHWPHIYCMKPKVYPRAEACLDYHGHRKYAINPRKVRSLQIHRPVLNDSFGHDLDTTIAKMNHFQGLINLKTNTCTIEAKLRDPIVWWSRGLELSDIARQVQANPKIPFAGFKFPDEFKMLRISV